LDRFLHALDSTKQRTESARAGDDTMKARSAAIVNGY